MCRTVLGAKFRHERLWKRAIGMDAAIEGMARRPVILP
jgi:hypothetical protein